MWWKILLGILLVLILMLSSPIRLGFTYREKLSVVIRYLFLKFQPDLSEEGHKKKPSRKKKRPKKEEDPAEKKTGVFQQLWKQEGLSGLLELLTEVTRLLCDGESGLVSHLRLAVFELKITVGGEDAADVAVKYGQTCAVVYPATSMLFRRMKIWKKKRRISLQIAPDFAAMESRLDCVGEIRISPGAILWTGIRAIVYLIRRNLRKMKGTMKHE